MTWKALDKGKMSPSKYNPFIMPNIRIYENHQTDIRIWLILYFMSCSSLKSRGYEMI